MVEFGLMLPMLVFGVLGAVDMTRAFAAQLAVQNGARAGAEANAIDYSSSTTETIAHARAEMARTPGLDANAATVTVTIATSAGGACPNPPTVATPCFATVRVQYTYRTLVNWPLVPNTFIFDRRTTVRKFNV